MHDVGQHALAEAVAGGGQHGARVGGRDAVQRAAQQRVVGQVLVGLQHERIEEEHAELPVARPRLVRAQALERADVDEHRRGAPPLDVVRGGVLQRQVGAQRAAVEVQLQQRRVLEHRERPLVRVGEERHALVAQRARRLRRRAGRAGRRARPAPWPPRGPPPAARAHSGAGRERPPVLQPRPRSARGRRRPAPRTRGCRGRGRSRPATLLSAARSRPRGAISRRGRARPGCSSGFGLRIRNKLKIRRQ